NRPCEWRFDPRRWPCCADHQPACNNRTSQQAPAHGNWTPAFRYSAGALALGRTGGEAMSSPVRVLVVDDSALMRKLIPQILEADSSIQVVGTAMDGNLGLKKIDDLKPQVITLDLEMPGMSGLEMLKEIVRRHRLPVIVVSSHSTQGASITLQALSLGAFDFVAKPQDVSARMPQIAQELIAKIKAAAHSRGMRVAPIPQPRPRIEKPSLDSKKIPAKVVAIGISTGGPQTLQYLLSQLPADFPG